MYRELKSEATYRISRRGITWRRVLTEETEEYRFRISDQAYYLSFARLLRTVTWAILDRRSRGKLYYW